MSSSPSSEVFSQTVILASQNEHKRQEFVQLLKNWQIQSAPAFDCDEDAQTYWGNALLKARAVQALCPNKWILADDSGLEVAALQERPGVYSARYGGKKLSAAERNTRLLDELAKAASPERSARFICCLVLLGPQQKSKNMLFSTQSGIQGQITKEPRSLSGDAFGYDPIFEIHKAEINKATHHDSTHLAEQLAGKTLAELQPWQKNLLSHRMRACKLLLQFLKGEAD